MKNLSKRFVLNLFCELSLVIFGAYLVIPVRSFAAQNINIYDYMFPASITQVWATGRPVFADQKELAKINKEYGDAYRVKEGAYIFTAPDRLEYKAKAAGIEGSLISTNSTNTIIVQTGFVKKEIKTDISKDITKRNTLFSLGLLPANYLETVRASYDGTDAVQGVQCEVFTLRYLSDPPNSNRRWKVWIDPVKRYVVQKQIWNMENEKREKVVYLNPQMVVNNFWVPTKAECFNPEGHLAGIVQYVNIRVK